jgi:phage-related protein
MADNRTFTLIGKFDDQISKKLREVNKLFADIRKSTESFSSEVGSASKSINKMTSALEDAGRAAGKVRDTVSQIGEGVKGLDGISESLESAARAAGRAQDEVLGIGEAAGRANRQADDLMNTLLKAEGLSKFGDAMAQGFNRGMGVVMGTIQKGAGMTAKLFKDAMDDELADIKAASGIQGSFALAGFKGDFRESERMYKKYDQVVSEMIRQSSAPTAKVVELQRYTLDTMGPLMLAAQGVKKGTAMKDIDPKKIQASATQYGQFLEKAALFSQGTGSAGFRVAAGIEGLVTRGKIDTTIDFFTDNIMLMKNLEDAGFMGRRGGGSSGKMMNATDAQRMAAMMEAFNKSMSGESTKAMATSLTGSLQGLQDTIFNPSVGILGMSVTFGEEEQKKANDAIRRIQNERIAAYRTELKGVSASGERAKQLRINIEQAEITRDQLIKDDVVSTPFKAFSYAFSSIVRKLTEAINAIGPVWTNFAVAAIEVTNKVFGPLGETLGNVASNMRSKDPTKRMGQAEGFGRIVGEIFKTVGQIMGDIANMVSDPSSVMGKAQSEFMKGFMGAFEKSPGGLKAAQENIARGLNALIGKFFEFLWKTITFEPVRPLMLLFVAGIFGPPLISAVIAGATPLIMSAVGKMAMGVVAKVVAAGAGAGAAGGAGAAAGAGALSALALPAAIAAVIAAVVIFQGPLLDFAAWLTNTGAFLTKSKSLLDQGIGQITIAIGQLISGITNIFGGLWDILVGMWTGDQKKIIDGFKRIGAGLWNLVQAIINAIVGSVRFIFGFQEKIRNAINTLFLAIWNSITGQKVPAKPGGASTKSELMGSSKPAAVLPPGPPRRRTKADTVGSWDGSLGDAISQELRMKPPGSSLVVANSSETIIPAAGGLGMKDFMGVLTTGFNNLGALFKKSEEKSDKNQNQTNRRFDAMDSKLAKLSTGGSMFGSGGPGNIVGVGKSLLAMGLQVGMNPFFQYGRGFLPGGGGYIGKHAPGSYHYSGRALDVSGPPGLLDAAYARLKATNPAELLWRVPGHYDHLHVAYAMGAGMPAFFSSQRAAMDWERKATLGNVKVSSITSNSSEGMGGAVSVNAPITIYQQPGQNPEQLAALVAMEFSNAINQARSSSMYV